MVDADLIVIGAGMAGINAAARAVEAGASVAVVERDRVGGTCPIRGCIPSKALIRSAEIAHEARHAADYGIQVDGVRVDMGAVIDRVQGIVDRGANGARAYLESLPGLRLVMGEAAFEKPGVVVVDGERIRAPRVIVATGNTPKPPPIPGLGETPYLTSSDVLVRRELRERLVVVGAGPIGLELGQALSRLGSRVTMVEAAPRLLMAADPEMGDELATLLRGEGIDLLLGATVERTAPRGAGVRATVTADGATRDIDADALLVVAGWASDVGALHLDRAGVDGGPKGVPVDARLQTSQDGHYAAGDVLGPPFGAYTHTARVLGRGAASNALDRDPHDVGPDHGPAAIFTDPEFVSIGLTEAAARERGLDVGVASSGFSGGKARAWGQERGLVKAVVDRATHRILGAQILAYHAADLIHPVVVAIQAGSAEPLTKAFHIHPTLGEPVQGAVRSALAG
ncbi:MAG TPA: FAD-dependent oxidoreductase [Miltoncostaeaceae bacterium]|nr:FAD-dependent oxidoreductase [Miltoncostaeaceae bacterium]